MKKIKLYAIKTPKTEPQGGHWGYMLKIEGEKWVTNGIYGFLI